MLSVLHAMANPPWCCERIIHSLMLALPLMFTWRTLGAPIRHVMSEMSAHLAALGIGTSELTHPICVAPPDTSRHDAQWRRDLGLQAQ